MGKLFQQSKQICSARFEITPACILPVVLNRLICYLLEQKSERNQIITYFIISPIFIWYWVQLSIRFTWHIDHRQYDFAKCKLKKPKAMEGAGLNWLLPVKMHWESIEWSRKLPYCFADAKVRGKELCGKKIALLGLLFTIYPIAFYSFPCIHSQVKYQINSIGSVYRIEKSKDAKNPLI